MTADELDAILRANPLNLSASIREWCLLAANWDQGGLNVWIHPKRLGAEDGMIVVLTDTEGVNHWCIRAADLDVEDPPVVSLEDDPNAIAFPSFSKLVAAMIVNDLLFDYETEAPADLNRDSARTELKCLVTSSRGDFFADAPLELATVVAFAYPGDGPVYGKSIGPAGQSLLRRLTE